ncbi:MAG: FCD domain-containing protein, partial [Roseiarcus sp.]
QIRQKFERIDDVLEYLERAHRGIGRHRGRAFEASRDEILRVRHLSVRRPRPLTEPIAEHRAIVAALRTRDPERSDRAMKAHLDASARRILDALAQYPGYMEHRA